MIGSSTGNRIVRQCSSKRCCESKCLYVATMRPIALDTRLSIKMRARSQLETKDFIDLFYHMVGLFVQFGRNG